MELWEENWTPMENGWLTWEEAFCRRFGVSVIFRFWSFLGCSKIKWTKKKGALACSNWRYFRIFTRHDIGGWLWILCSVQKYEMEQEHCACFYLWRFESMPLILSCVRCDRLRDINLERAEKMTMFQSDSLRGDTFIEKNLVDHSLKKNKSTNGYKDTRKKWYSKGVTFLRLEIMGILLA